MEISTDPAFSISTPTNVLAIEFSPFEWSRSLLAVGHPASVAVYSVKLKEEVDEYSCQLVWECHTTSQPNHIAWSPNSTLQAIPKQLQLLVSTQNHSVLQLSSNLKDDNVLQEIGDHKDHINSIAYSDDNNDVMGASTGDDLVAKVWKLSNAEIVVQFFLSSPGMYIRFNPDDSDRLLVAERCGILRFYSISGENVLMSLRTTNPLLCADWSLADPCILVAAGPLEATLWNLSELQSHKKDLQTGIQGNVVGISLSRSLSGIGAIITNPNTFKIISLHSNKVPVVVPLKVISGISWHSQLPYLAVASDAKIHLWRSESY